MRMWWQVMIVMGAVVGQTVEGRDYSRGYWEEEGGRSGGETWPPPPDDSDAASREEDSTARGLRAVSLRDLFCNLFRATWQLPQDSSPQYNLPASGGGRWSRDQEEEEESDERSEEDTSEDEDHFGGDRMRPAADSYRSRPGCRQAQQLDPPDTAQPDSTAPPPRQQSSDEPHTLMQVLASLLRAITTTEKRDEEPVGLAFLY